MGKIATDFGSGGKNLNPGQGDSTNDDLPTVLRDVADDLHALQPPALVSPAGSDPASVQTLVNEIRTKWNAIAAATLKTTKT